MRYAITELFEYAVKKIKAAARQERALAEESTGWAGMDTAPHDGRTIRIAVRDNGPPRELPYPVRWYDGRWCYARHNTRLFQWHEPQGWKP